MANRAGVARFGDGQSTLDGRIGQQGDLIVSSLHADYYEQAVRKNIYFSFSSLRATSLVGTGLVGHIIYNPPDSNVNLALLQWDSQIVATSATTTAIALAAGYQPTTPTSVTASDQAGSTFLQQPTFLGGKAKAYAAATVLVAPVVFKPLHHNTAAIAVTGVDQVTGNFDGSVIVPPGCYVAFVALGAAAAASSHTSWISWEEVPIL
jgi:hypothetical protein